MNYSTPNNEYKKMIQMENSTIYKKIGLPILVMCLFAINALAQPTISKQFSPSTIGPGSVSTITFTITNGSGTPVTGLAFTDVLPAGVTIADPASATTTCLGDGITITAPAGGTTITLADGELGGFQSCTVTVNVTSSTPGVHTNPAITLSSSAGSSMSLSVDLTVDDTRPGFSKSFSPSAVDMGEESTLTFTFDNTANALPVTFLQFTDNLPPGMVIADQNNLSTDCGMFNFSATAPPGSSSISLLAIGSFAPGFEVILAGGSCTLSVDVVTSAVGTLENVTENLVIRKGTDPNNYDSGKATDDLEVTRGDPVHIQKSFTNDPAIPGGTVDLEFKIINFDRNSDATGITFTDDLDAFIAGMTPVLPLPTDPCGTGSMLNWDGSVLTLSGGNLNTDALGGNTCTFIVTLNVPAGTVPGTYINTTGLVSCNEGTGNDASAPLYVEFAPLFTKTFLDNPVSPGSTTTLEFTITNTDPVNDLTDISFTDMFSTIMPTASATPANGSCGAGSTLTFTQLINPPPPSSVIPATLTLSNGSIPGGGSCTFTITLDVLPSAAGGIYNNTTSTITGMVNGDEVEGLPATDDLEVLFAPSIVKEFESSTVSPGGQVDVTFTIEHSAGASSDLTDITFTDDLNAFLAGTTVVLPPNPDPPCGVGSTFTEAGGVLTLMGGTLQPGATCSFTVTLNIPAGTMPGTYTNTTGAVSGMYAGLTATGAEASDEILITDFTYSKEFIGDPSLPGETITLRFTFDNLNGADPVTINSLSDDLNSVLSGLTVGSNPTLNDCPMSYAVIANKTISFGGATVPANTTCTVEFDVMIPAAASSGTYANVTTNLNATIDGNSLTLPPATDNLVIDNNLLNISKEFIGDPVDAGETIELEFVIENIDATRTVTDIAFTDDLDDMLPGAVATGATVNTCGGMSAGFPTNLFDYSGGMLLPMTSCTIRILVEIPATVPGNFFTNTTSEVTGMVSSSPVTGGIATDELQVRTLKLTKAFDGPADAEGSAMLTFTIENLDAANGVDNIDFFDNVDAMLSGATVNMPILADVSSCGEAAQITTDGMVAYFQDGSLNPGGSCTFSIKVNIPCDAVPGFYTNTTSPISANGLESPAASADLEIQNSSGPPSFTVPPDITIECDESTDPSNTGDVDDESHPCCTGPLDATYSDVENLSGCNGTGTITRTWTLVACNGEMLQQTQIITIEDTTPPSISCPPDMTIEWPAGFNTTAVGSDTPQDPSIDPSITGEASASDNCGAEQPINCTVISGPVTTLNYDGLGLISTNFVINGVAPIPAALTCITEVCVTVHMIADIGGANFEQTNIRDEAGNVIGTNGVSNGDCNIAGAFSTMCIPVAAYNTYAADGTLNFSIDTDSDIDNICATQTIQASVEICTDCGSIVPTSYQDVITGPTPSNCPFVWVVERTWTATDGCGLTSTCVQTFTFTDNTPPSITCPDDITIECDESIDPTINTMLGEAIGVDNCDPNPVPTYDDASSPGTGCAASEYAITRTWTLTDVCGNESSTCDQIINVEDNTAPNIACPPTATIECDKSTGPITAGYAVGTDSCDPDPVETYVDISNTQTSNGTCTDQSYTIVRQWKATDACGNMSGTCDQTIIVVDSKAPIVTCPPDISVECDDASDPAATGSATAVDNCDTTPTITFNDVSTQGSSGCAFNQYTITRTWKGEDNCGNSNTCDQIITVEDLTPPVITCPADVTIECDGSIDPAVIGEATAIDNCAGNPVITHSDIDDQTATGDCTDHTYTITRTWTATDVCGKMSTCDQTINVVDTNGPAITCPGDITVECDASTDPADTGEATAIDNCDANPVITSNDASTQTNNGTCTDYSYTITRTWKATDDCNNMNTCDQVITVEDTTPPVVLCQDITITLNSDGEWNIAPADVFDAAASFDNCSATVTPIWVSKSYFSCLDEGANVVTLSAEDACGNTSICTATVTVSEFLVINDVIVTNESCTGQADGKIEILATAGGGQIGYSIDNGANYVFNNIFSPLTPGTYDIKVKVFGIPAVCEKTAMATVGTEAAPPVWYKDNDNDGYSDGTTQTSCTQPAGGYKLFADLTGPEIDCDDNDPLEFPGQEWHPDTDNDGYGGTPSIVQCERPAGHKAASELTETDTDCDDSDEFVYPGAPEICNGIDDDCDGDVDEGLSGETYVGNVIFTTQAQVDAWPACYSIIDGNVTIQYTDITNLATLSNIVQITGTVSIQLTGLTDLSGLDNLTTVNGSFVIYYNPPLTSLNGLQSLNSVGGSLIIYYNFMLSDCCAIQDLINGGGVAGSITIFFNASGCNSIVDINNNCPSPQIGNPDDEGISNQVELATSAGKSVEIYPNPVSSILNVQFSDAIDGGKMVMKDIMGRQVAFINLADQHNVYQINTSSFVNGLYLIEIRLDNGQSFTEKIVIEH